jgi:beta-N-acetylhexosaminidase
VTDQALAAAPFNLDAEALAWVNSTYARLSTAEKVAQLFVLISMGDDPEGFETIKRLKPGGITRFFGPDRDKELANMDILREISIVPPLISADLEGSRLSLSFGTPVLNPLGLAAVNDVQATAAISRVMAEEARAIGVNWSFTPVVDINKAFRSAIVATRGFGSDVDAIERHALTQIEIFQAHGVAATVKHWPGEGYDARDQHLVTTINPLSMEEWEATFGRVYRAAIKAGVLSVMSAHIALPAYVRSQDPDAGVEAFRPASVSSLLNQKLLRETLGFNGLIVSDATPMAGLGAWENRQAYMPELIANGCDVILFSDYPEDDMANVLAAVESGYITAKRFEDAVKRVLGLKAHLGLHKEAYRSPADRSAALGTPASKAVAQGVTARAPTLVKDVQGLLPLDLGKHKRVLVITPGIIHPFSPVPIPFTLPGLLEKEGFAVTVHQTDTEVSADNFDVVLYLFGDETLLTRSNIFIDWMKLGGGGLHKAMSRPWHDIPTLMIGFGYPYYLYDAPRVPTYINAYSTLDTVQAAVVDCLLGRAPWNKHNPVDPFCGLEDARY